MIIDNILLNFLCSLATGSIYLVLESTEAIHLIFEDKEKRTEQENKQIKKFYIEILIFVPLSIILFNMTILPFIVDMLPKFEKWVLYSISGLVAYKFPFVALRNYFVKKVLLVIKTSGAEERKKIQELELKNNELSKQIKGPDNPDQISGKEIN